MIEDLLNHYNDYKLPSNYRSTNKIIPVSYNWDKYLVKVYTPFADIANIYYSIQDSFFYGRRSISLGSTRAKLEANKLKKLNGFHAPLIYANKGRVVVREFLEGNNFNENNKKNGLYLGFEALCEIHKKDIIIGDCNVKNLLFSNNNKVYWLDFENNYEYKDINISKALDLLKFVYSTYTMTHSEELILDAARLVSKVNDSNVREKINYLVTPGYGAYCLWFPTRMPLDNKLNRRVKNLLRN